jgi:hypothetical protein
VAVANGFAYVAANQFGFTVVDVSDPDAPVVRGSVSSANLNNAWDVTVVANFAYVAASSADALTVVDISDPDAPVERASISSANLDGARSVAGVGDFAYVASETADSLTVIKIIDATCTGPARPEGALVYSSSSRVMQYCDGANWVAIGKEPEDPCDNPPVAPGTVCKDGKVYAGLSPDGGLPMYVAGSGTEVSRSWNNGAWDPPWTATGFTSTTDGDGNTAGLVALVDAGSPYEAAIYCDVLDAHGYQDWYLPALDELNLLWNGGSPIAGVNTSGSWYWSSSEVPSSNAWIQRFSDGNQDTGGNKNQNLLVRCVRK